jgi:ABC-2 type transport system permease protein
MTWSSVIRRVSNMRAVAYKEAMVLRHDKAFLAVVFVQPIMMMTMFGTALSNKPENVPWAVLDRSNTPVARRLVAEIEASGHFLRPRHIASYDEGRALLRAGDAVAVLVLPQDLARGRLHGGARAQLLLDGADPLSSARVAGYITEIAAHLDTGEVVVASHPRPPTPDTGAIALRQRFWFNPTLRDRDFFLSVLAAMLLTNLALSATSLALVGERENGTYEQMLSLPTSPVEIVLGKLAPYVVLCYLEVLIAVIPTGLIFGVWPRGSWITLMIITLPFILSSLAIGTFISSVARNSAQSVFLAVFIIMPSFVLSGVNLPYQLMPEGVRQIGDVLPLRWYQIALRRVFARGAGLAEVWLPMAVLTTIFLVMLAAVAWRTKPRLG